MKKKIALAYATACYIGFIPGAPGTYASVATSAVFYLIWRTSHPIPPALFSSTICLIAAFGTFAAAAVSRELGQEDPQIVVVDEVAGQLMSLFYLPVGIINLLAATFLFRLFDIWKPFPIRRLERLPHGVGIMADDLLAGVYANLVLQAANWLVRR